MSYVNSSDSEMPQGIAITGAVKDSAGKYFNPDSCSHAFAYASGNLVTDTATDGTSVWVKTFGYTSGVLTSETKWVRQ